MQIERNTCLIYIHLPKDKWLNNLALGLIIFTVICSTNSFNKSHRKTKLHFTGYPCKASSSIVHHSYYQCILNVVNPSFLSCIMLVILKCSAFGIFQYLHSFICSCILASSLYVKYGNTLKDHTLYPVIIYWWSKSNINEY